MISGRGWSTLACCRESLRAEKWSSNGPLAGRSMGASGAGAPNQPELPAAANLPLVHPIALRAGAGRLAVRWSRPYPARPSSPTSKPSPMPKVRLSYDGWLALPAAVREKLGLSTGYQLELDLVAGAIVLRPAGAAGPVPTEPAATLPPVETPPPVEATPEPVPAPKRGPGRPRKGRSRWRCRRASGPAAVGARPHPGKPEAEAAARVRAVTDWGEV